jgi:hypothetical protein
MLIATLDVLLGIWLRSVVMVDGVLGNWVDLQAPDPLLPAGSTFVDQLAVVAIGFAEFIARLAAQFDILV